MTLDLFDNTPDEISHTPEFSEKYEWCMTNGYTGEPVGTELQVRFTCPECGNEALSDEFCVPGLNLMAEKASELGVSENFDAYCKECNSSYELYVVSDVTGAEIYTHGWDTDVVQLEYRVVTESLPYNDVYDDYIDAISANTEFSKTFNDGIRHVRSLAMYIQTLDTEESTSLARMLYAHVITLMETFLSDALINTVLRDEALIRRVVERISWFKEQKFSLSAIYAKMASVREIVQRYLARLLYHDIKKVRTLYKDVLEITLPASEDLENAINQRHDIVHRNGRTKEGDTVNVGFNEVMNLADLCERFVSNVDKHLPPPSTAIAPPEDIEI